MKAFEFNSEMENKFIQMKLFDFLENYDDNNALNVATLNLIKLTDSFHEFCEKNEMCLHSKKRNVKIVKFSNC